jgi:hypothetical protein
MKLIINNDSWIVTISKRFKNKKTNGGGGTKTKVLSKLLIYPNSFLYLPCKDTKMTVV